MFLLSAVLIGTAFAGGYAAARAARSVYVDGKAISTDVIELNGNVYMPVADVARVLNRRVVARADGYDLLTVGDAAEMGSQTVKPVDAVGGKKSAAGLSGTVGEPLTNGQVAFMVVRVIRGASFSSLVTGKTFAAESDRDLVAVVCRMRNNMKKSRRFDLGVFRGGDTGLIGATGQVYPPSQWDRRVPIATLRYGEVAEFAVIFSVPKNAAASQFVYQVRPNDFDSVMRADAFHIQLRE